MTDTEPSLRAFRTPVRGHAFAGHPSGAASLRGGEAASLVREPANPADPLAVAVWVDAGGTPWRVGYLDRGVAARLAPRLDRGARLSARIDGWVTEPDGRWHRPLVLVVPESPPVGVWGRPPGVLRRRVA